MVLQLLKIIGVIIISLIAVVALSFVGAFIAVAGAFLGYALIGLCLVAVIVAIAKESSQDSDDKPT